MIDGFYVIKDGLNLYVKSATDINYDENLISGFLTALTQFANTISDGEDIKQIVIGDVTFSFVILEGLIFVFRQKELLPEVLKVLSNDLITKFLEKYGDIIDKWDGIMSIEFDSEFEEIMNSETFGECKDDSVDYVPSEVEACIVQKMKNEGYLSERYDWLCKICMMEIMEGLEEKIECLNNHPVHKDCLKEWIAHSTKCPTCRVNYPEDIINRVKELQ